MTIARVLGIMGIVLFFCFTSTISPFAQNLGSQSAVDPSLSGGFTLFDGVQTRTNTFELRSNGNLVTMNDNIRAQWQRLKIYNNVDGTLLSDYCKVIQLIENVYAGGMYHDVCTMLLGHPNSYNPYSDVLIELVVAVNNTKCNVVIVDKGDDPLVITFDNQIVAYTQMVTQDGIYFIEDQPPSVYGKWVSFNFWK